MSKQISKSQIYSDMLTLQTKIQFPFERHLFESGCGWADAQTVLDVGCGNLSYAKALDDEFPGRKYTGVEIDPEMNAIAKSASRPNMQVLPSLESISNNEKFDIVLLRLVLLHVPDRAEFLATVASHLKSSGSMIVFDADDEMLIFDPKPPEFVSALNSLRDKSKERNLLPTIEAEMNSVGLELGYLDRIVVNNRFPHASEDLFKYMYRTAELGIGTPLPSTLSCELVDWWVKTPYVQYGFFGAVFSPLNGN